MLNSLVAKPAPAGAGKAGGPPLGTPGSLKNKGNTIAKAVDGNTTSYFDAPAGVQGWVGYDLGAQDAITQVQFLPRSGFASRMVGGVFQGSSTPDFSAGVTTLYSVAAAPAGGVYTAQPVNVAGG